jgi:hypothetical protein
MQTPLYHYIFHRCTIVGVAVGDTPNYFTYTIGRLVVLELQQPSEHSLRVAVERVYTSMKTIEHLRFLVEGSADTNLYDNPQEMRGSSYANG